MLKFAVVTPVRNAGHLVVETMDSILSQEGLSQGEFGLDYVVWDGNSTDDTAELARGIDHDSVRVISAADQSMYDGLARGFALVKGDVYFYLNAGDLLLPGTLRLVARLFETKKLQWVSGMNIHYSQNGSIVRANVPLRYRQAWIRQGFYGRILPPVQQESTFWSDSLMSTLDLTSLSSFKLAGDFFIWHTFSEYAEPVIVQAALGGFRYHGEHLSADKSGYHEEMTRISGPTRFTDRIKTLADSIAWHAPLRIKKALNAAMMRYDPRTDQWN